MKHSKRGFTLLEVMVAVTVLSLGTVLIFQSYFSVMRAYDYCASWLGSCSYAREKLWEAAESVKRDGLLPPEKSGEFSRGGKTFGWGLTQESAGGSLYRVGVTVRWSSGKQEREVDRSAYVMYEPQTLQ